jgi:site-specific DNA recombinase
MINPMNPKTAIIYTRVSTTDQVDSGASLDNQERACYDWTFRNGIKVLKQFREEGKSAKTLNRPKMQEMLVYVQERLRNRLCCRLSD